MMKKLSNLLESQGYNPRNADEGPRYSSKKSAPGIPFDFFSLVAEWPNIVGKEMSSHTLPLKNVGKTLTILSDHPAYSQSLKLLENMLIEKIEKIFPSLLGKMTKIHFQVNSQFFKETKTAYQNHMPMKVEQKEEKQILHPQSPQYKELVHKAELVLKDVEDPEIKKRLTSLFIQMKLH